MTNLEAALYYSKQGWKVFPVAAGSKAPATIHGVKDATTDEATITNWFKTNSSLNVAVATGPESGVWVADVDPRNGGDWVSPVDTLTASTPSGGSHYFFRWPADVPKLRRQLGTGIDVQGTGKYVLVSPSVLPNGEYVWSNPVAVAEAPQELLAQIVLLNSVGDLPGNKFNTEHTWEELLKPYGWQYAGEGPDSQTFWTRPGKDEGISASTNYMDTDCLYIFSTSTGLAVDTPYSKFAFFTEMEHGGDFSEAARAIAGEPIRIDLSASHVGDSHRVSSSKVREVDFTPALPPTHIISEYIAYGNAITDAAPEYHEAAALSLLSTLTAGAKIALAPYPDGLATNLFLVMVGDSSVSRKSTVQSMARHILKQVRPNALIPDRMTGASAINELSGRTAALWMPDEFGMLMQQVYTTEYLRPIEELLLTLYSGQSYQYVTVGGGTQSIYGLHLGVFGAATPHSLSAAGHRAIGSGLLPRFGVVYPERTVNPRPPAASTPELEAAQQRLVQRFRDILISVSKPGVVNSVTFSPMALSNLSALDSVFGANPLTARLVTAAYKVAAITSIADGRREVNLDDAQAADVIVKRWADGANRLRSYMSRPAQDVAFFEVVDIAREALATMPGNMENGRKLLPLTAIARKLNIELRTIKRIRETLEATGEVMVDRTNGEEVWHVAV